MSETERLKRVREAEHREAKWDAWAHQQADTLQIKAQIFDELRERPSATVKELAELTGVSPDDCIRYVKEMAVKGQLVIRITPETIVDTVSR